MRSVGGAAKTSPTRSAAVSLSTAPHPHLLMNTFFHHHPRRSGARRACGKAGLVAATGRAWGHACRVSPARGGGRGGAPVSAGRVRLGRLAARPARALRARGGGLVVT